MIHIRTCCTLTTSRFKDPEASQVASAKVASIFASLHKGHSKEHRNDKD